MNTGQEKAKLAGQKRDMGKRLASEISDPVDVPGRRVTRSSSVRVIDLSKDKCHSAKPYYMPCSEQATMIEDTTSKDLNEGLWPFVSSSNTEKLLETGEKEKGSQDPLSSDELRNMFLAWAKEEGKRYESPEEQEERFQIWCSTKKVIDQRHSHEPGYTFSIDYMNLFADMTDSEAMMMDGDYREESDPYDGLQPPAVLQLYKTKEGLEEVKKARIEFDEWVARHKRNYGNKKEQRRRFMAYLDNKKKIDMTEKLYPGYWTYGYDLENMDKFFWEHPLIPEVAPANLGKPLAGQKRDMGKRSALEIGHQEKQGADELAAGRMATSSVTRSLSNKGSEDPLYNMFLEWAERNGKKYTSEEERKERFKNWCSTKEYIERSKSRKSRNAGYTFSIDDMNGCGDMALSELGKMFGGATEIGPDPHNGKPPPAVMRLWKSKKGLKTVEKAKIEFKKWVARHKKQYGSRKEREKRFMAFLDNVRKIDLNHKLTPGTWTYGYDLKNMDKYSWESPLF